MDKETKLATDILSPLSGRGDWIPDVFKHIFKNGKSTDLVTCCVFSKILYWYTLSRGGRKKYSGKFLRLSCSDIAKQVCITYTQAKRSLSLLEEKYEFISRVNRGKVTSIELNVDKIRNAVEAYQPSIADAELVYGPSVADEESNELSVADKEYSHELSVAHEDGLMGYTEPIHIHKEGGIKNIPRKDNSKKLSEKERERLELNVEELTSRLECLVFTEKYFLESCYVVENLVTSRINNGEAVENLLNFLLSSALSSDMYPAYARIHYILKHVPEKFESYQTEELLYQFRTECIGNAALIALMEKHCPNLDMDQFNFNVEKMINDSIQEYNKLLSQRDALAEKLKTDEQC